MGDKSIMNIYYQQQDATFWHENPDGKGVGIKDNFFATKSMHIGDLMLYHLGGQDKDVIPGVYAVGIIISEPYIFKDPRWTHDLWVDTVIVRFRSTEEKPLISDEISKVFGGIYRVRKVGRIDNSLHELILNLINK